VWVELPAFDWQPLVLSWAWQSLYPHTKHLESVAIVSGDWGLTDISKTGIDFDVGLNGPLFPLIWMAGVCALLGEFETGNCFHIELLCCPPALALCTAPPSKFVQTCQPLSNALELLCLYHCVDVDLEGRRH